MTNQEIEDYINNYRVYPDEYKGVRDPKILSTLHGYFKYKVETQTITRREGRINDEGNFEIVGYFRFQVDKPEDKIQVSEEEIKIAYAPDTYNRLVIDLGYKDRTVDDNTKWNVRDLVSEVEYIRSTYYEKDHVNNKMRQEDLKEWTRRTNRIRQFIRTYKPYIDDLVVYEKHNSKYDNLEEVNNE